MPTLWERGEELVHQASEAGLHLRLLGSCAVVWHCEQGRRDLLRCRGSVKDIDLAGYAKDAKRIGTFCSALGYRENLHLRFTRGFERRQFSVSGDGAHHLDVYLDHLRASHAISWKGRLEVSMPTIYLADLLLTKLQVHDLASYDDHFIDTWCLLAEHELGDADKEGIDLSRILELCGRDWALWRNVIVNLGQLLERHDCIPDALRQSAATDTIVILRDALHGCPKTLRWRARALLGERFQWYEVVEPAAGSSTST